MAIISLDLDYVDEWLRWRVLNLPDNKRPRSAPHRIPDPVWLIHTKFMAWGRWVANGNVGPRPPQGFQKPPDWARDLVEGPRIRAALKKLGPPLIHVPTIPDLGPWCRGGMSLLDYDMTHAGKLKKGTLLYPACDGAWGAGTDIIAPERLKIYQDSSAVRRNGDPDGDAFYAVGVSGTEYWVAHLVYNHKLLGKWVAKGMFLADVSRNHDEPHGHLGVYAQGTRIGGRKFGKELLHNINYKHGKPTIREQFTAFALAA